METFLTIAFGVPALLALLVAPIFLLRKALHSVIEDACDEFFPNNKN